MFSVSGKAFKGAIADYNLFRKGKLIINEIVMLHSKH